MTKVHHYDPDNAVYVSAKNALGRDDYVCGADGRPYDFRPEIEDAISSDFAKTVMRDAIVAIGKGEYPKWPLHHHPDKL